MRQHGLGPYPIDPSLIAQGIPIDDRTNFNDNIHAPIDGTPLPPGPVPLGTPPGAPPGAAPLSPLEAPFTAEVPPPPPPTGNSLNGVPIPAVDPPPAPAPDVVPNPAAAGPVPGPAPGPVVDGTTPQVAPSSFGTATPGSGPKVAVAEYNPRTGEYVGSNGKVYKVTNLVAGARLGLSWKDLLPH
jgi:hypothetical protein